VPPRTPETLSSLTALRGVCAIIVMVLHLTFGFAPDQAQIFLRFRPYLAVDVFFLMSGLVMAHVYGASLARDPRQGAADFLRARVARIYPLHVMTLCAVIVIVTIWPYTGNDVDFSLRALLLQFGMLQGLPQKLSWNYPSWSVGDEMLAYLLFRFTARPLMTGRYGWPIAIGCAVALTLVAALHHGILLAGGLPGITRALVGFTIGVLTYRAWRADRQRLRRIFAWLLLPGLLIAAALRNDAVMVFDLGMVIILALEVRGRIAILLNCGPLQWLGDWSYSIYLWHVPVLFAVTGWCRAHEVDPFGFDCVETVTLITALAIATILLAAMSYHGIEQPARRLLRARRTHPPALAIPPAALSVRSSRP
jgi:peptidoglycan/LPS O-acetylase OafA/YrhL